MKQYLSYLVADEAKGVYGKCTCGGDICFFKSRNEKAGRVAIQNSQGVICKRCGKQYGVWTSRKSNEKSSQG